MSFDRSAEDGPGGDGSGKIATRIAGLDFLVGGGIPAGRTTLVSGGPGCGKTVLAAEFVIRGAEVGEPGVFVSFEQTVSQVEADLASFDFPLEELRADGRLALHRVGLEDAAARATGAYTLDGLFLQLESLLDEVGGGRRLALDTLDSLFAVMGDDATVRREMRRLFLWLEERGVTSVVTAERGRVELTRYGLEEFVSDCVILLDYRVEDRIATRRARVLKCRGGAHDGDEHPFVITDSGLQLYPLTRSTLSHEAPSERVSSGLEGLDRMLGGEGFFRGSSILVSGTPGAGKSTLAAAFVDGTCRRGERALYFAFEESEDQIVRNMRSVGIDLRPWVEEGLLHIRARRPSEYGLEYHLRDADRALQELEPDVMVLDPFTSLTPIGFRGTTRSMMIRLVDLLKSRNVTAMFTSLAAVDPAKGHSGQKVISSLMDAWVVLEAQRRRGRRRRFIWILKSRGMEHSPEIHEVVVEDGRVAVSGPVDPPAGGPS